MSRPGWDPHRVDPSRATQHPNVDAYRAGQLAGRAAERAASHPPGGGIPPRRTGCPLKLLLLALLPLLVLAGLLRHRAPEPAGEPLGSRRDRPHHPDGWQLDGGGREPLPPEQQDGQRRRLSDNLTDRGSIEMRALATFCWALALCAITIAAALAGAR